jgi:hypothetical protein
MSVKQKRFILLSLTDTDSWGWNEVTLPMLIQLIDVSNPDARLFTHMSVVAHYFTSRASLKKIEDVVERAESMRASDKRFSSPGITIAEGEFVTELDDQGRVKDNSPILGDALIKALQSPFEPNQYKEILQVLKSNLVVQEQP